MAFPELPAPLEPPDWPPARRLQPSCDRCLDLRHVPARHPLATPDAADVMPCPDCRTDDALDYLRRRPSRARSLADRVVRDRPIRLG